MTEPFGFDQCDLPGCTETANLKKCSKCQCVAFCGRDHQTISWKLGGHKKLCAVLTAARQSGKSIECIRSEIVAPAHEFDDATAAAIATAAAAAAAKESVDGTSTNAEGTEGTGEQKQELNQLWTHLKSSRCECGKPSCEMDGMAVYRKIDKDDAEPFFTGMSHGGTNNKDGGSPVLFKKHHDPSTGNLDDDDFHMTTPTEILTEFAHYHGGGMKDELTLVALMDLESGTDARGPGVTYLDITKVPISTRDMKLYFRSGMNCGLVDFSHKPAGFRDPYYEDSFDVKFPFPDGLHPEGGKIRLPTWRIRLDIRAGDCVRVLASGTVPNADCPCPNPFCGTPYNESFNVIVISITSFGMITGTSLVPPDDARSVLANSQKTPYLGFPITCVIGVVHTPKERGGNW